MKDFQVVNVMKKAMKTHESMKMNEFKVVNAMKQAMMNNESMKRVNYFSLIVFAVLNYSNIQQSALNYLMVYQETSTNQLEQEKSAKGSHLGECFKGTSAKGTHLGECFKGLAKKICKAFNKVRTSFCKGFHTIDSSDEAGEPEESEDFTGFPSFGASPFLPKRDIIRF